MAKKVLFINQEIDPYVAETHMSIMGRELPQKMQEEVLRFAPLCLNGAPSMSVAASCTRSFACLV